MRLLIDTNIFLEIILEQEEAEEAKALLSKIEDHEFFISDFSLHSIGLLLFHRKQYTIFQQFLKDMILNAGTTITLLFIKDMEIVITSAQKFGLDFDDAYQYVIVEKYGLTIVSFDTDFDRTECEWKNTCRGIKKRVLTPCINTGDSGIVMFKKTYVET